MTCRTVVAKTSPQFCVFTKQHTLTHDNMFPQNGNVAFRNETFFIFTSLLLIFIISCWLTNRFGCLVKWDPPKEVFLPFFWWENIHIDTLIAKRPREDCGEDCKELHRLQATGQRHQHGSGLNQVKVQAGPGAAVCAHHCCSPFCCSLQYVHALLLVTLLIL